MVAAYQRGGFDGIGFVFHKGNPYAGADIDNATEDEAREWIDEFDSYTERSPSGNGFHIICKAKLPKGTNRAEGELYSSGRFFTMTGDVVRAQPVRETQDAAEKYYAHLRRNDNQPSTRPRATTSPRLTDSELISKAENAKNGANFRAVYRGGGVYDSPSDRDMALASMIAFYTDDEDQIERVMRGSGCAREKWDEHRTYLRERTIRKAIDSKQETYSPGVLLESTTTNGRGTRSDDTSVTWGTPQKDRHLRKGDNYGVNDTSDTYDTFSKSTRVPDFPTDALPATCQRYVEEAAAALKCPAELVGMPVLTALSGVIGRSLELRIKPGWTESALLYAGTVDEPGGRKSPAASIAYKPVEKLQAMLRRSHKSARETYEKQMRQHAVDKKIAARDDRPEPEPPVPPKMRRVIVDDITVEALASRLEENPRGFLSAQDELTGFLRGLDQYKSGGKGNARQTYLKIWSGRAIIVDRKGSDEPLAVPDPFVTLQGGIQPAVLHEIAGGRDDGFLDRFIFGYPEPHQGGYSDDYISAGAEIAYENLIGKLWDQQPAKNDDGEITPRTIRMDPEAKEMFKETANALEAEKFSPGFPEVLRGPWSKFDTHLARLALIIGAARIVEEESIVERITAEDMANTLRLLDYFKATTRKVYGQLFETNPDDVLAADLVTLLTQRGYKFFGTTSDLLRELVSDALPDTPDALGRAVRRIVKRSPDLTLESHRTGHERTITITLKKVSEVSQVSPNEEQEPKTNPTNSQTHTADVENVSLPDWLGFDDEEENE